MKKYADGKKEIEAEVAELKKHCCVIRVLAHTQASAVLGMCAARGGTPAGRGRVAPSPRGRGPGVLHGAAHGFSAVHFAVGPVLTTLVVASVHVLLGACSPGGAASPLAPCRSARCPSARRRRT